MVDDVYEASEGSIFRKKIGFKKHVAEFLCKTFFGRSDLIKVGEGYGIQWNYHTMLILPLQTEGRVKWPDPVGDWCFKYSLLNEATLILKKLGDYADTIWPPEGYAPLIVKGSKFEIYVAPYNRKISGD